VAKFVTIQGCCAVFPTTETKAHDATDTKRVFVKRFTEKNNIFFLFFDTPNAELNKSCRAQGLLQPNKFVFRKNTLCGEALLKQSTRSK